MTLEFLPEAFAEREEAVRYYETCVLGLGTRLREEIETVCAAIVRGPLLWRERPGGYRSFAFYLAYFPREERLIVAAVAHAKRHPDYWKKRQPQTDGKTPS
jgi:hypothetical protein